MGEGARRKLAWENDLDRDGTKSRVYPGVEGADVPLIGTRVFDNGVEARWATMEELDFGELVL
jgi:hypothetical protein